MSKIACCKECNDSIEIAHDSGIPLGIKQDGEWLCDNCLSKQADSREPNYDNYHGPRGGEAASELAHRQEQARRLK